MSKPVEQHYIPKTYLRHFQIDNDKNKSFVYCIDFSNQYKTGVQRVGINDKVFKFRKYYNDNRLEDPYALEKVFAQDFEPDYDKIVKALKEEKDITLEIREKIVAWTYVSKMRNPSLRDNTGRIMGQIIDMTNKFEKKVIAKEEQEQINNYVRESAKQIQIDSFINETELKKLSGLHIDTLVSKRWKILKSQKVFPFWTNDNPGFSPNLHPKFSEYSPFHNVMELNHASVIYYVLSPDYCLEIKPFYEGTPVEINAFNMDIQFEEVSLEYIEFINRGVFHTRHRLLISNLKTYLQNCVKRDKNSITKGH